MAGGELMVHRILRYLKEVGGHNIKVITMNGESATFEGIDVLRYCNNKEVNGPLEEALAYKWADIQLAHLSSFRRAAGMRRRHGVPLVAVVHNPPQIEREGMNQNSADMALFNAEWCKNMSKWHGKGVVVTPPMFYDDWQPNEVAGDCITLINLNENKGGAILEQLAKAMPDRKFLAVMGSYGPQLDRALSRLPNVEIHQHTTDIRGVYKRSRIVLMPSDLETWGMVASEAMACAVPVIVSPTLGLMENTDFAGLYADRNKIEEWVKLIKMLDDEKAYKNQQRLCRERFKELCADHYLKQLDVALQEVIESKGKRAVAQTNQIEVRKMTTGIKMIALRSFVGQEGTIRKNSEFIVGTETRAAQLAGKGTARFVARTQANVDAEKKVMAPSVTAVAEVKETKSENPKANPAATTAKNTKAAAKAEKPKKAK